MVYEPTDNMSAVKKLSKRGTSMKLSFGGKASKKAAKSGVTDDEGCAVIAPAPPPSGKLDKSAAEIEICPVAKGSDESVISDKIRPNATTKGFSKKSVKNLFRRRRPEDNENADSEPKINHYECRDNGKPGSTSLENNGEQNGTGNMVVMEGGSTGALGNQCTQPEETGTQHIIINGKVGYVTPVKNIQLKMKEISLVNGSRDGHSAEEVQGECDASGRDMNGNPGSAFADDTADDNQNDHTDVYQAPELPLRLQNSKVEPGLPPRPPKPASLRYRPPIEPCSSLNGVGDRVEEDDDIPPRPPARPKNRTIGGGSLRPWNNLIDDSRHKRGTVYETISLEPKEASLAEELAKLPRQPWYWGPLTQVQAEEKLAQLPDGSFLVRDSSDERYLLSLSFNSHGRTLHTRIEHRNGLFSLNDSDGHSSVVELIECAVKESRNGVYGYMRDALGVQSFPARLTNWVSRFKEMRSLQHLCRFLIREVYPRHHIQRLPLPKKIKEYILENQY